jgi:hypothetical protein
MVPSPLLGCRELAAGWLRVETERGARSHGDIFFHQDHIDDE